VSFEASSNLSTITVRQIHGEIDAGRARTC
jgi:hypothetical protein